MVLLCFWSGGLEAKKPVGRDNHPDIILRDAFLAQVRGRHVVAISLFEQYLKRGRESAYVRGQFAKLLSKTKQHERAERQARRALELNGKDTSYYIILADVLRTAGKPEDAIKVLETALSKFEGAIGIEYALAETYNSRRKFKQARLHFKQVLFQAEQAGFRGPYYRNIALWRLANIYLTERDITQSRIHFVRYLRHNPENWYAHFVLGYYLYFGQGLYEKARKELELIQAQGPRVMKRYNIKAASLYSALGEIYFIQNDYRALPYLRKSVRLTRKHYLDRGLYFLLKGDNRNAARNLLPYVRARPQNFIARTALVRLMKSMKKPELLAPELLRVSSLAATKGQNQLGIEFSKRAQRLKENNPNIKVSLSFINQQIAGHYEALKQPHRTLFYLRRALEEGDREGRWKKKRDRTSISFGLSRLLSSDGIKRNEEAIRLCNQIIKSNPDYARAYYMRGLVWLKAQKYDKAISDFSLAIKRQETDYLYFFFRAVAYHEMGNFPATDKDLKTVLSLNPDFAEANNFLGYIYAEKGIRLEEARKLIQNAIRIAPANGAYQDSLGWLYFQVGKMPEARYHLKLAELLLREQDRDDPTVFEHLGDVYRKLNAVKQALLKYRQALHLLEKKHRKAKDAGHNITEKERELMRNIKRKINKLGVKEA